MKGASYLEETKRDVAEMVQILSEIPENKKESILMLVRGVKLGIESEEEKRAAG